MNIVGAAAAKLKMRLDMIYSKKAVVCMIPFFQWAQRLDPFFSCFVDQLNPRKVPSDRKTLMPLGKKDQCPGEFWV
jgi:hypothetical protein